MPDDWGAEYQSPDRFEDAMVAFATADRETPPPANAIVCTGSSTMRGWHEWLADDLAPLTVIGRGFGGSNMNEALHYVDRCVLPYHPRAILLYEGDNDLAQGVGPARIVATFDRFLGTVRAALPHVHVYVMSVKPSPSRWELWPAMQDTNRRLAARCRTTRDLFYVDVATPMLDAAGRVRAELFGPDLLHLNRLGYDVWRAAVRPVLLAGELPFESPAT